MTTLSDKSKHKLQQLNEAIDLIEDISNRIAWATDFCKYDSINEILNTVYQCVDAAQTELEDNLEELEEAIEQHDDQLKDQEDQIERESELTHYLS